MNTVELSSREQAIIQHVCRYTLGTTESIANGVCPELSPNALKKVLQKLIKSGHLRRFPLYEPRFYYILSRRTCVELQLSLRRSIPLGHEALVQHLAVLAYCDREKRQLLTQEEFVRHFPEFYRPHLPSSYYFLDAAAGKLGWIVVDHGSRPDRFVAKISRVIGKRYPLPDFAKLIQAGGFFIVLLTATPLRGQAIERALAERPRKHVDVQVHAIPDLVPLIIGASHAPLPRPKTRHAKRNSAQGDQQKRPEPPDSTAHAGGGQ